MPSRSRGGPSRVDGSPGIAHPRTVLSSSSSSSAHTVLLTQLRCVKTSRVGRGAGDPTPDGRMAVFFFFFSCGRRRRRRRRRHGQTRTRTTGRGVPIEALCAHDVPIVGRPGAL